MYNVLSNFLELISQKCKTSEFFFSKHVYIVSVQNTFWIAGYYLPMEVIFISLLVKMGEIMFVTLELEK